ncbi:MAG TPA: hypothetical protein PKD00_03905 [Burkholderiales bacterium]|nr:hypothetical protein [Burkholderiales bacterium]
MDYYVTKTIEIAMITLAKLVKVLTVFLVTTILVSAMITRPIIIGEISISSINLMEKVVEELETHEMTKAVAYKVNDKVRARLNALPDKANFIKEVNVIAKELGVRPELLVIKFYIESKIDPGIANKNTNASGIFQLMPRNMPKGTTAKEFRDLTATEQLKHYRDYILPYKKYIKNIEDLYVANLCPAALIKGHQVLYKYPSKEYIQNKGLDMDKNGDISRKDIRRVINSYLEKDVSNKSVS